MKAMGYILVSRYFLILCIFKQVLCIIISYLSVHLPFSDAVSFIESHSTREGIFFCSLHGQAIGFAETICRTQLHSQW